MYKCIVSDFDGTLTSKDGYISDTVKLSIKNFLSAGYFFSIATGKSFYSPVEKSCVELALKDPIIVCGGAEIFDSQSKKVLFSNYLKEEEVKSLITLLLDNQIIFEINRKNYVYTKNIDLQIEFRYKKYKPLEELIFDSIAKIRIITGTNDKENVKKFIETVLKQKFSSISVVEISRGYDITSEKATKHVAVLELAKILKITPNEMVGVGDGYNDYPLLSACGYKVAISTAPKELKEIADFVIDNSRGDAISVIIEKLFKV